MDNQERESKEPRPLIDADLCKSCGRCIHACPRHCLRLSEHLNNRGLRHVEYIGEGCIGCEICFYNCPEPYVLTIEKPAPRKGEQPGDQIPS